MIVRIGRSPSQGKISLLDRPQDPGPVMRFGPFWREQAIPLESDLFKGILGTLDEERLRARRRSTGFTPSAINRRAASRR